MACAPYQILLTPGVPHKLMLGFAILPLHCSCGGLYSWELGLVECCKKLTHFLSGQICPCTTHVWNVDKSNYKRFC